MTTACAMRRFSEGVTVRMDVILRTRGVWGSSRCRVSLFNAQHDYCMHHEEIFRRGHCLHGCYLARTRCLGKLAMLSAVSPSRGSILIMRAGLQVDFGGLGLGQGTSDLEHSIMLRQRSLSSRTSLDDMTK